MTAFESVSKGLEEALAFADGNMTAAKVHEISVVDVDVAEVRQRTGLSQAEFARSIGVAKGTLLNWEHGRRHPTGPAQVLLALIAKKPSVVQDLLRGA
ncbi:helix-turn-helix domain-containing protein [Thalassobacter stenotrophicus]|jgi:putative transcriptional regulator|uniref:Antitoxin igA-2 n=2 Tax=Thalassobacter stenotrophicus TaxID=266809 RepID=A0A0P1FIG1_9RHOB|nr:helix-turn-helix domain-containing protein [Thalassobacter stenotrophicus]CUH60868.1 Antitoxin igA-2 [Thalassobacter stenotrophicus]SHJ14325.1 putative transcriptional regulator [Thalassobacter stenotrophicus DSM 16310]